MAQLDDNGYMGGGCGVVGRRGSLRSTYWREEQRWRTVSGRVERVGHEGVRV